MFITNPYYRRGLSILNLYVMECNFHVEWWVLEKLSMTCDKIWGENNYFVLEWKAVYGKPRSCYKLLYRVKFKQ